MHTDGARQIINISKNVGFCRAGPTGTGAEWLRFCWAPHPRSILSCLVAEHESSLRLDNQNSQPLPCVNGASSSGNTPPVTRTGSIMLIRNTLSGGGDWTEPPVAGAAVQAVRIMNNENSREQRHVQLTGKEAPHDCHSFTVVKVTSMDASPSFVLCAVCRIVQLGIFFLSASLAVSLASSMTSFLPPLFMLQANSTLSSI